MSGPLVLGIESSCDETGVGIVRGHELLANEVASSVDLHVRFGGVVPEVASRAHLEALIPTLERAAAAADIDLSEIDAVAVTAGPGLMGALVVGLAGAKALAYALGKPFYAVNHLAGHVAVDLLEHGPLPQPAVALLVSGGHTSLLQVADVASSISQIGSTIDDAAGEAYDKVARLLGLAYPGGPVIDRAATGDPAAIRFPRGLTTNRDLEKHRFDFSFSGLKTSVARWVEERERDGLDVPIADVAASFQEAVCDVLSAKAIDACRHTGGHGSADRRGSRGEQPTSGTAGRAGRGSRNRPSPAEPGSVYRQRRHDRRARVRGRQSRSAAVDLGRAGQLFLAGRNHLSLIATTRDRWSNDRSFGGRAAGGQSGHVPSRPNGAAVVSWRPQATFLLGLYKEKAKFNFNGYVRRDPLCLSTLNAGRMNPYPFYERIRAAGPVSRSRLGVYTTADHDVVSAVLRSRKLSSASA